MKIGTKPPPLSCSNKHERKVVNGKLNLKYNIKLRVIMKQRGE
jgi:hypothetical protein